uniref:HTH psq-type domain-containing protein n=1 Tax=Rhodnius prolixus TaxID=13249 RepID=T1ICM1_RHOPR
MVMPRKYQRKTNIGNWTADQLLQAISAVKRGIAIREAGREYGIPEATIRKRMKLGDAEESTKGPNMGKSPIFSEQQEKELSEHVLNLAKMFYGMTSIQFRKLAFAYAEANNIKHSFNINRKMAGKDWYYQFLKRHPEISLRKPEI